MAPPASSPLTRFVFSRHCHPISAWSRWATTPLLLAPLWTRSGRGALAVGAWFALNPVMTPPPADDQAFATRAMLGEERWLSDHTLDPGMGAVNAANSVLLVAAAAGAWARRPLPAVLGTAGAMALTMYCWARYAAVEDRARAADDAGTAAEQDGAGRPA